MHDWNIWYNVLQILKEENVNVDSGRTFNINAWHFNRDVGEDIDTAKAAYREILHDNWNEMIELIGNPSKSNCKDAIKIIGMLSHAWQDYYAHAIHRDSDGGRKTIGQMEGNPDNPGKNIKPASWGGFLNWGEHGASEPGERAPDTNARLEAAKTFTKEKYSMFASKWWKSCECYAKEMFK